MRNKSILLVEDNSDDEILTLRALRKNNILFNEVMVVRDGVEALDYLFGEGEHADRSSKEQPKVVLLDLKLPRLDGLEVLKKLRADPRTKLLPVVMLTSSNEDIDIVTAYEQGANSYIRKPVDFGEFVEMVRQIGLYWLTLNVQPPKEG